MTRRLEAKPVKASEPLQRQPMFLAKWLYATKQRQACALAAGGQLAPGPRDGAASAPSRTWLKVWLAAEHDWEALDLAELPPGGPANVSPPLAPGGDAQLDPRPGPDHDEPVASAR